MATHMPDEKKNSGNFWCSTEKAAILLLLWSTLYIWFSKKKMSWIFLVDFHLTLVAQIPDLKLICSWILGALRKEASISLYKVFSICKVSWLLIVYFTLSLVSQTPRVKRICSQSSRCSAKEATILIGHPDK